MPDWGTWDKNWCGAEEGGPWDWGFQQPAWPCCATWWHPWCGSLKFIDKAIFLPGDTIILVCIAIFLIYFRKRVCLALLGDEELRCDCHDCLMCCGLYDCCCRNCCPCDCAQKCYKNSPGGINHLRVTRIALQDANGGDMFGGTSDIFVEIRLGTNQVRATRVHRGAGRQCLITDSVELMIRLPGCMCGCDCCVGCVTCCKGCAARVDDCLSCGRRCNCCTVKDCCGWVTDNSCCDQVAKFTVKDQDFAIHDTLGEFTLTTSEMLEVARDKKDNWTGWFEFSNRKTNEPAHVNLKIEWAGEKKLEKVPARRKKDRQLRRDGDTGVYTFESSDVKEEGAPASSTAASRAFQDPERGIASPEVRAATRYQEACQRAMAAYTHEMETIHATRSPVQTFWSSWGSPHQVPMASRYPENDTGSGSMQQPQQPMLSPQQLEEGERSHLLYPPPVQHRAPPPPGFGLPPPRGPFGSGGR